MKVEESSFQYTDPDVSVRKFDREIGLFTEAEIEWRQKGVFCIRKSFPEVELLFSAPATTPPSIVFSVVVNFLNYDNEPPSVRFTHPFTGRLVTRREVPVQFLQVILPEQFNPNIPPQVQVKTLELLQGADDEVPFLCIPGVREYHDNPAHTGDSWFLYRSRGEGTLGYIIDILYNHSIGLIKGYKVNLQPVINFEQSVNLQL